MTAPHGPERINQDDLLECQRRTVYERIQDHQQLVWLSCATISLLTTRNLLVESNLHYPLQVYSWQLWATAILALISRVWRRNQQKNIEQKRPGDRPIQATLLLVASQCLQAISALCLTQAVLHTSNLPLLCMMATIAFFAEGLILHVFAYTPRSSTDVVRLALLFLACTGILLMEYRLMVPSLIASILSVLLLGLASALKKLAAKHYPGEAPTRSSDVIWLVAMGALVAAFCAISGWPTEHGNPFDRENALLRAVNAFSTGAALLLGGSVLFPVDSCQVSDHASSQRIRDALMQLAMTATVGCFTTLSLRRSYSSWHQLCFYMFAILCVCGDEIYDAGWKQASHPKDPYGSYDMVPCQPRTVSDDSEEAGVAGIPASRPDSHSRGLRSSFSSVILIMLWTAYVSFNFGQRQYPGIEPQLDLGYEANGPVELVISMYKEPTSDVASLISRLQSMPDMSQALVTIYLKDNEADEERVKRETNAHNVIKLPNVGREAETYLNHIVTRWDNLAERTVFLQADVHNPREFYPFFERYFRANQTGFLNLGWAGNVCNSEDCGDKYDWKDETMLFPEIQSRIDHSVRDGVLLSYKGQFIVTAARIRGIDKAIYEDLWKLLVDENSWAHKQPYLQGREDSMDQPWFGYTMERIWNVLFQCSDMDIAWKCPTLLSGWRPGGTIADCQCFDTEMVE